MKFILTYLRGQWRVILFLVLSAFIFFLVFRAMDAPSGIVFYPVLLSAFIGLIFLGVGVFRAYSRHLTMKKLIETFSDKSILWDRNVLASRLPVAQSLSEQDDMAFINSLLTAHEEEHRILEEKESRRETYDTAWVHQIKTPLAAMRLQLENEIDSKAQILKQELFRIEQCVETVLAYRRLESPVTDYVFHQTEIDDVLRTVIKKLRTLFIGGGTSLSYEPVNMKIVTDEKWISFVFEQILTNAAKYAEGGEVLIAREDTVIHIKDNGIGIAPEDLPRVFEAGFTGKNGRIEKHASGIGLSMCKQILDGLGYIIAITSVPGEGTCVSIDFAQKEAGME